MCQVCACALCAARRTMYQSNAEAPFRREAPRRPLLEERPPESPFQKRGPQKAPFRREAPRKPLSNAFGDQFVCRVGSYIPLASLPCFHVHTGDVLYHACCSHTIVARRQNARRQNARRQNARRQNARCQNARRQSARRQNARRQNAGT